MTQCKGTNCPSTDGQNHSPECRAEHAAAVAGGRFVKSSAPAVDAGARDDQEAFKAWAISKGLASYDRNGEFWFANRVDGQRLKREWQARAALSAPSAAKLSAESVGKAVDKLTEEQISTVIDEWYYHADEPVKEKLASFARAILSYSATASDKEGA